MRVKLTLMATGTKATLPLNYNHAVAGLIYRTLGNASEEFAVMLHDEGFKAERRTFKLFTFSRLFATRSRVAGDRLLLESPAVTLLVSSPVVDFVEHFISGLFQSDVFNLYGREPDDSRLRWEWDEVYITEQAKRNRRPSVLIEVSEGIKVRSWLVPFTIEGSKELIEIDYEAGFGKRNAMGFGLAEVAI